MPVKRVLMIAHHFPPTGGSGANRALAFTRYLPENGWEPIVVTPGNAWAANRDDRLLEELPAGLQVIRTRSFEGYPARPSLTPAFSEREREFKPLPLGADKTARNAGEGWPSIPPPVRSNLGHLKRFPDAHLGWLPFALAAARRVEYDVAYSSSGPFTSHVVGMLLKRWKKRPWVAELRDGWYRWNRAIFPDYPGWRNVLERALESAALKHADRVVLVTDRMAASFRCQYQRTLPAEHFVVVPNGFDRLQFGDSPVPIHSSEDRFDVLHTGALYYGRSLAALLEAAARLASVLPAFAEKFTLTLIGTLDPAAQAEVAASRLGHGIRFRGQLGHAATIEAMRAADLLLLVANTTPGAEATVPGKLFEYLAVGRPVLAIGPRVSSTADVLNQTGGGWLAPADDPAAIDCALRAAFQAHQDGLANVPDVREVAVFDRRVLTANLARILDQADSGASRRH